MAGPMLLSRTPTYRSSSPVPMSNGWAGTHFRPVGPGFCWPGRVLGHSILGLCFTDHLLSCIPLVRDCQAACTAMIMVMVVVV